MAKWFKKLICFFKGHAWKKIDDSQDVKYRAAVFYNSDLVEYIEYKTSHECLRCKSTTGLTYEEIKKVEDYIRKKYSLSEE